MDEEMVQVRDKVVSSPDNFASLKAGSKQQPAKDEVFQIFLDKECNLYYELKSWDLKVNLYHDLPNHLV